MSTEELGVGSQIRHPKFGEGVLVATDASFYKIYFHEVDLAKNIARDYPNFELLEKKEMEYKPISLSDIEKAVENTLIETLSPFLIANMNRYYILNNFNN